MFCRWWWHVSMKDNAQEALSNASYSLDLEEWVVVYCQTRMLETELRNTNCC